MKVTSNGSIYKCKTNPRNYKFLRKLATDYLRRLHLFINMFVDNHNFVGMFGLNKKQKNKKKTKQLIFICTFTNIVFFFFYLKREILPVIMKLKQNLLIENF